MSRLSVLFLQLTILLVAVGIVLVLRDGVWASDAIIFWTAVLAVALSAIIASQISIALRKAAREKRAQRSVRKARRPAGTSGINHTARFQRAADPLRDAKRRKEREESRRLNIEAEIRLMNEAGNKW